VKIEKVRELSEDELRDKVTDLAEEIFRTRLQKETGQLDQMGKVRELRRDLARVKTVLRQMELATSVRPSRA
jgi:large subunit ribosomal protein L29